MKKSLILMLALALCVALALGACSKKEDAAPAASDEPAVTPLPLEAPPPGRRSIPASLSWVPSCAGLMLAGYVVRDMIGAL